MTQSQIPWLKDTAADSVFNIDRSTLDVEDLYDSMDHLLKRQPAIQKQLADRNLADGYMVFYDLTSTYFEGEHCVIARFGYNRDGKKGKLQVVVGMTADTQTARHRTDRRRGQTQKTRLHSQTGRHSRQFIPHG